MNLDNSHSQIDLEYLTKLMDDQFELFGFKFGLNFFIDLIPGAGDIVTTAIAFYIFFAAIRYKASALTLIRMLLNIGIYFLIGLIPWVGDIFGTWWKPNRRNLRLLQKKIKA